MFFSPPFLLVSTKIVDSLPRGLLPTRYFLEGLYLCSFDAKRVRINKKVQDFYEVLEAEDAKRRTAEENERKEIEKLPEAYVEAANIPLVEATIVEGIPVAVAESDPNDHIDFSQFELREEEYIS